MPRAPNCILYALVSSVIASACSGSAADPVGSSSGSSSGDGGGSSSSSSGVNDAGPAAPRVSFYGRRDLRDAASPRFAFPSGRVVARFEGTSATVTLTHTAGFFGDVDCLWEVIVDGAVATPIAVRSGTSTKTLASNLATGTHIVEMYRRGESAFGTTQIVRLDFPGGKLLAPEAAPTRRIEMVADSQFEGYGIEASSPTDALCTPMPKPAAHNARKSAMELVAKRFGAELLATAYSGKGLGRNAAGGADTVYWKDIYPRALGEDGASTWSFANAPSDAVVITVGGQDFDPTAGAGSVAAEEAGFQTRYTAFVDLVRSKNPSAHVFLTIGPQLKEGAPAGLRSALRRVFSNVVATRSGAGDAKVYVVEIDEALVGEETGCQGHGSPALHAKMATAIETEIARRLGW